MIIPDAVHGQANFRFTGPAAPTGAEVTCGFAIEVGGPILPVDIANAFITEWNTTIRTVQHSNVTLDSVYVKTGPNATGSDGAKPAGLNGAIGGDCAPANLAILVRKVTATGGKRGRGRMYWPGVPEAYIDSAGVLGAGVLAAWQTQASAFLAAMDGWNLPLCLLHSPGISIPPAPTDIVALTVQGTAGTQRQRMRR